MKSHDSRFRVVSRRALFLRSAAIGAIVVIPGLACASSDEEVFENASTIERTTTTELSDVTALTTGASTGEVFPAGAELVVGFSYTPSSTGEIHNPYIAVWVEDPQGNLVRTISLWINTSNKGLKYVHELRQWYATSDGEDLSMSSATRVAGDYTVAWDGADDQGNPVAQGDYFLYIEASREKGPYELMSQPVTIGSDGFHVDLADEGELTDASIELVV